MLMERWRDTPPQLGKATVQGSLILSSPTTINKRTPSLASNATTTIITTSTNQALSIEGQQLDTTPTSAYTTITIQQDAIESEGSPRGPLHLVNVANARQGQFKAVRLQYSSNGNQKKKADGMIGELGNPYPDDTAGIARG